MIFKTIAIQSQEEGSIDFEVDVLQCTQRSSCRNGTVQSVEDAVSEAHMARQNSEGASASILGSC